MSTSSEKSVKVSKSADKKKISSEKTVSEHTSSSNKYIIIGVVVIVVLLLAGFLIWYFFWLRREKEEKQKEANAKKGKACTSQSDCGTGDGLFCSGNGICEEGSGQGSGACCSKTSDCTLGLVCLDGECKSTNSANTKSSSVTNFRLSSNGKYLNVTSSGSTLGNTGTTFTYSGTKEELSAVSGSVVTPISINKSGELQLGSAQDLIVMRTTGSQIQIEHPCGAILSLSGTKVLFPQTVSSTTKCKVPPCPTDLPTVTTKTPLIFTLET